jgi:hypothetical protein
MKKLKKLVLNKEVVSILAGNEMNLVKGGTYTGGTGTGGGAATGPGCDTTPLATCGCTGGCGPTGGVYLSACYPACTNAGGGAGPTDPGTNPYTNNASCLYACTR